MYVCTFPPHVKFTSLYIWVGIIRLALLRGVGRGCVGRWKVGRPSDDMYVNLGVVI